MKTIARWLHSAVVIHFLATAKGILIGLFTASCAWGLGLAQTGQTAITWQAYVAFIVPVLIGLMKKNGPGWLVGPGALKSLKTPNVP